MKIRIHNAIQKYLLETQLWVAMMITALAGFYSSEHLLPERLFFIFFSTLGAYNFIHYHRFWINKKRKNSFIVFISSVLLTIFSFVIMKEKNIAIHVLALIISVLFYNSWRFPVKLRNISLLKIFVISAVWTVAILYVGNDGIWHFPIILSLFLLIFSVTLTFDIADQSTDKIKTIPMVLGTSKTKCIAIIFLLISTVLFYCNTDNLYQNIAFGMSSILIILGIIVTQNKSNHYFYTRFWMEASLALPFIIYTISKP